MVEFIYDISNVYYFYPRSQSYKTGSIAGRSVSLDNKAKGEEVIRAIASVLQEDPKFVDIDMGLSVGPLNLLTAKQHDAEFAGSDYETVGNFLRERKILPIYINKTCNFYGQAAVKYTPVVGIKEKEKVCSLV